MINNYNSNMHFDRIFTARIADGDFGAFFDTRYVQSLEDIKKDVVMGRIISIIEDKKNDLRKVVPVKYNIIDTVASMIVDFALPDGVKYDIDNSGFDDFWKYDKLFKKALKETLKYGYAFIRTTQPANELELVHWSTVRLVDGVYSLWNPIEYNGRRYVLVNTFDKTNSKVYNNLYIADGTRLGTEVPLETVFEGSAEVEDGTFFIMQLETGEDGLGVSYFEKIIDKIQAITFLDMMTGLEFQEHFLSKLELPERLIEQMSNSRIGIKDMTYIPRVIDNTGESSGARYVTKATDNYYAIEAYKKNIVADIAFQLRIPRQLLSSEDASAVRVEAIKQNLLPFARLVKEAQDKVYELFDEVVQYYYPNTAFTISFDDPLETDDSVQKQLAIQLFQEGLISHRKALELIFDEYNTEDIDAMLSEATVTRQENTTTFVDNFIAQ